MITIAINKKKLLGDLVLFLTIFFCAFWFVTKYYSQISLNITVIFFLLISIVFFTLSIRTTYILLTNPPAIIFNSKGVAIKPSLGKIRRAQWKEISQISIVVDTIRNRRSYVIVRYLQFRRKSEKEWMTYLNIPVYNLNEPIEEVVSKLLTIPAASKLADTSLQNIPSNKPSLWHSLFHSYPKMFAFFALTYLIYQTWPLLLSMIKNQFR